MSVETPEDYDFEVPAEVEPELVAEEAEDSSRKDAIRSAMTKYVDEARLLNAHWKELHTQREQYIAKIDRVLALVDPDMLTILEGIGASFRLSDDGVNVYIAGDYNKLLMCLRLLAKYGLMSESKPSEKETTFSGWFRPRSEEFNYDSIIYLYFTSTVCKRVKVGEELVMQPKYDIVCGES